MITVEGKLSEAVCANNVLEVKRILEQNVDVNVNFGEGDGPEWPVLYTACDQNHVEIVKLLLAHKDVNVNIQKNAIFSFSRVEEYTHTPLYRACHHGHVKILKILLEDPRVNTIIPGRRSMTPLCEACAQGQYDVVELLIASGKDLNIGAIAEHWFFRGYDKVRAIEIARYHHDIVSLLQRFENDQTKTRHEIRLKLGQHANMAAELFATAVFLCDQFVIIDI
jgi:hypothetical protein